MSSQLKDEKHWMELQFQDGKHHSSLDHNHYNVLYYYDLLGIETKRFGLQVPRISLVQLLITVVRFAAAGGEFK